MPKASLFTNRLSQGPASLSRSGRPRSDRCSWPRSGLRGAPTPSSGTRFSPPPTFGDTRDAFLLLFFWGGVGGRLQPCPKLAAGSRACGCSHHLSKLGFRFPSRMARPRRPGAPESPRPWTRVRPGSTAGAGRCSSRSPAARTSRRSRNSSSSFVFRQPLRAAGYLFGGAGACARPRARAHQSARSCARARARSPCLSLSLPSQICSLPLHTEVHRRQTVMK